MSIGCDEGNFSFPEECALAPLDLSSPRSILWYQRFSEATSQRAANHQIKSTHKAPHAPIFRKYSHRGETTLPSRRDTITSAERPVYLRGETSIHILSENTLLKRDSLKVPNILHRIGRTHVPALFYDNILLLLFDSTNGHTPVTIVVICSFTRHMPRRGRATQLRRP